MSSSNYNRLLNLRERIFLSLFIIAVLLAVTIFQVSRTERRTRNLYQLYERIIFSNSSITDPEIDIDAIFDRNIKTAWIENIINTRKGALIGPTNKNLIKVIPSADIFQITMEVGLSHFPGKPPVVNPLKKLRIWPGFQRDKHTFREYSRPKRITFLFFKQKLVDMDTEYKIPGLPEYLASKSIILKNRAGYQEIDLGFLPKFGNSPRFPVDIYQIWMRIIIHDYYPGSRFRKRIAISEIDFKETYRTHKKLIISR